MGPRLSGGSQRLNEGASHHLEDEHDFISPSLVEEANLTGLWADAGLHSCLPVLDRPDPAFSRVSEGVRAGLGGLFSRSLLPPRDCLLSSQFWDLTLGRGN